MIEIAMISLAWLYGFWCIYILVMGLYRAYLAKRLIGFPLVLATPMLAVGYAVDLVSNWTLAVVIFAELPRRPLELVTDRLTRYITTHQKRGYRRDFARWVCTHLLDPFDPSGAHCK